MSALCDSMDRSPCGMVVQVYSLELAPDGGGLSVLPKAGLQRAADKLLGANVHSSGSRMRVLIS